MAENFGRFVKNARPQMAELSSPAYVGEAAAQDMHPANVQELQMALQDRRHQSPMQQQVLGDELKRIKMMQTMQLQRAAQAMPQQMQRDLSPAKTGEQWPTPEATMLRIMLQMQRRHGGFRPESAHYDMKSAQEAGLQPDETGHWPSRIPAGPQEGLLLKGRAHPTWHKTEQGEREAGYEIQQGPRGRYYSRPR